MKKVIIIGATSGIGRSLARIYIQHGNIVGITGRRNELLTSLKNEFPASPVFIITESFDVCGDDNIKHIRSLIDKLGGLDLLIYNSGFGDVSEKLEWELDKKIYETNVKGFIEIVHFAFNYFATQGHGQIAATSSIASTRGNSFAPAYSASKAFMSVYMEGLHMKSRRLKANIAITDIQPGFVNTKKAKGNKKFWVAPVEKAAKQMFAAIEKKKWRVFITTRWWLVAKLLKWVPGWIYHRFG